MMKEYQVTLFDRENKYKPVSCIVKYSQEIEKDLSKDAVIKKTILKTGIEKICLKRGWCGKDLKKFGYVAAKVRLTHIINQAMMFTTIETLIIIMVLFLIIHMGTQIHMSKSKCMNTKKKTQKNLLKKPKKSLILKKLMTNQK